MAYDLCVTCHESEGKYKCPRCSQRTCSAACSKQHRESHPAQETGISVSPEETDTAIKGQSLAETTSDTGPPVKANELADMPEFKMLINRYPQLLTQLSGIAAATDPPASSSHTDASNGGIGASKYMGKKQEPWTPDIGIQKGMEVLKTARQARGAESEGIREFIELHRLWLARQQAGNSSNGHSATDQSVSIATRKQLAQADAEAINQLLRKEEAGAR